MLDLAIHYDEGQVLYATLQEARHNRGYLEQVFAMLKKEGLVKSARGAQGGYKLSDRPENIIQGDDIRP